MKGIREHCTREHNACDRKTLFGGIVVFKNTQEAVAHIEAATLNKPGIGKISHPTKKLKTLNKMNRRIGVHHFSGTAVLAIFKFDLYSFPSNSQESSKFPD